MRVSKGLWGLGLTAALLATAGAVPRERQGYRLKGTNLKERIIWGAECREPAGRGLAFGGQHQDADDGRPHTRLLDGGAWKAIHGALRAGNALQGFHDRTWAIRCKAKAVRARARFVYFTGGPDDEEAGALKRDVAPGQEALADDVAALIADLGKAGGDEYGKGQVAFALEHLEAAKASIKPLTGAVTPAAIKKMRMVQVHLELAAEALDAEPAARALNPGTPQTRETPRPAPVGIVYDATTRLYVIFGGDHLDYLTNDTWVFDPEARRWLQRHPKAAPPPRAGHRLQAMGDGTVRMTGGYNYTSSTGYVSGQYADIGDGDWTYDVARNVWTGGGPLVPPDSREYRTGPFHPDFYLQGDRPDAAAFEAKLKALPANEWVATNPPYRPRLNRDWGKAIIDPGRDMMLRWSGGHSAHGGSDVPHFHFATNRWELAFPVEFPLGQLYSNTSYPSGYNFNRRPWMTGHTYNNYAYDPPSRKMVKAGRPRHYYLYDPDLGDWVGRGRKPPAMTYNSCFYTLTVVATPKGALCWTKQGKVLLFDHAKGEWTDLKPGGDALPGAYVDNSTIAYDSKRDRVLIVSKGGYRGAYDGQVYALDMKTNTVRALSPGGMAGAATFAFVDRCCYDAQNDLLLMASYLSDAGEHTPTPALDCTGNRWVTLTLAYKLGKRYGRTTRAFPHGRSAGIMYDPKRRLIWGTDTNSQVYVLRLDPKTADMKPLE